MGKNNKPYTTESFKAKLIELGRKDIEVIGEYVNSHTKIKVKCTNPKCNCEFEITPNSIISKKAGCPICSGRKVVKGINDLLTIRPDLKNLVKPGQNLESVGIGWHEKIKVICPDCGTEGEIIVYNLTTRGYNCPICGEKWSTPNRFLRSILLFLLNNKRIKDMKLEYIDSNIKEYRFDGYVLTNNNKKILIEMQGEQHNKDNKRIKIWEETKKQVEKDKDKKEKAIKNGYKLIEINCYKINFDYISNYFIKNTKEYFTISKEELLECWRDIHKSLTKKICILYNKGYSLVKISKELNISKYTVKRRLKIGNQLGWCKYKPKENKKIAVEIIDKNKKVLFVAESLSQASRILEDITGEKYAISNIRSVCMGKYKQYKGYIFKYINNKDNS